LSISLRLETPFFTSSDARSQKLRNQSRVQIDKKSPSPISGASKRRDNARATGAKEFNTREIRYFERRQGYSAFDVKLVPVVSLLRESPTKEICKPLVGRN
jgi:hypothetical protein